MASRAVSFNQSLTPEEPERPSKRLWWTLIIPRRLTDDERREQRAQRAMLDRERSIVARLRTEADACARVISDTLEDLNICYRYPKSERDVMLSKVKRVAFRKPYFLSEEALYLPVDLGPRARPRGVGIEHLCDENVLRNLSGNVGRKVDFHFSEETGFVFVVWRMLGTRAIPQHVKYDDILALRPASADSLSIPFGLSAGKRVIWRSLGQMVSLLVAGTTGGGKSNLLRVIISTLINANSPRRLRIGLIDLKRGVEFSAFEKLPHLLRFSVGEEDDNPALIDRRAEVLPFLEFLIAEGERRLDMLKESQVVKLSQYNQKHPRTPLAHICIIIDEWADIKLEPKIGPAAQEALINVASRFRAAGISVICCTQYPQKEVVSMRLKAVMPAKIAFSMPNMHASVMVLNSSAAFGLTEAGRAVFQWGREEMEIQTPYINNDMVSAIVAKAVSGEHYKSEMSQKHDVTSEEIFEWAVNQNSGNLDWRSLHGHFKSRGITQREAQRFPAQFAEHSLILVGAASYRVMRPAGISSPWRLLPVEEDGQGEGMSSAAATTAVNPADFEPDEAQQAEVFTDKNLWFEGSSQVDGLDPSLTPDCDSLETPDSDDGTEE